MGNCCAQFKAEWKKENLDYEGFNKGEWIEVFGSSSNRFMQNPTCYSVFELSEALLISAILVWSICWQVFEIGCGEHYMTALTHWTLILEVVYFWFAWWTTHRAHAMRTGTIPTSSKMPWYATVTWVLQDLLIPGTFMVVVLYWVLVAPTKPKPLATLTYFTHGVNFLVMILDVYVSKQPYFLLHGLYYAAFGLVYLLFTLIYWACGGTNCEGEPYIYKAIDWSKPESTGTLSAILLFVAVPIINMLFWFLISQCFPRPDANAKNKSVEEGVD